MTKLDIIIEKDPVIFQDRFNSKMEELQEYSPTYEFVHSNGFCAYITYEYITTGACNKPKTSQSTCLDCVYSDAPPSDRVLWCRCRLQSRNVNYKRDLCENFDPEVRYGN